MSCDRFAQVHAYHDDALAPSDRVAVEAHLEGCADCRALLSDLRGLSNLIAAAPLAALSPAAMARLSRSLRATRDQGILRITSWLTATAAAVLVGALLLWPDRAGTGAGTGGGTTAITIATNGPALETVAIMPPESEDAVPEVITLAQWMANDLSYSAGLGNVGGGGVGVGGVGGDRQ
jgi:predicted anti-sigma-YlaC factor YlaD